MIEPRSGERQDVPEPAGTRLGDALAALGRRIGLTDDDIATLGRMRDPSPASPMSFD